jgi:hypothetical protein
MPRDLAVMRGGNDEPKDKISRDMDKQDHLAEIKPYVQTLTISDVDSAVKLEDAAFPPEERATREKVIVPPSLHFVSLPPNPTCDHTALSPHPKPLWSPWRHHLHLFPFLLEPYLLSLRRHHKITRNLSLLMCHTVCHALKYARVVRTTAACRTSHKKRLLDKVPLGVIDQKLSRI